MEKKTVEQLEQEINQLHSFYQEVITDFKNQIGEMADKKAFQAAINAQNTKTIQSLGKRLEEMEKKTIDNKTGGDKK